MALEIMRKFLFDNDIIEYFCILPFKYHAVFILGKAEIARKVASA